MPFSPPSQRVHSSWASSTSRRTRSRTAAVSSRRPPPSPRHGAIAATARRSSTSERNRRAPGAKPVSAAEEHARLAPVLAALITSVDVAVSIDTTKAGIAALAIECGAAFINDQWGLQGDPAMAEVAATNGGRPVPHAQPHRISTRGCMISSTTCATSSTARWRSPPRPASPRIASCSIQALGLASRRRRICGRSAQASRRSAAYGRPVLVGASRKSLFAAFIGSDRRRGSFDRHAFAAHLTARTHGADISFACTIARPIVMLSPCTRRSQMKRSAREDAHG